MTSIKDRPEWASEVEYSKHDIATEWDAFFLQKLEQHVQNESGKHKRVRLIKEYIAKLEKRNVLLPRQGTKTVRVAKHSDPSRNNGFVEVAVTTGRNGEWIEKTANGWRYETEPSHYEFYTKQDIEQAEDVLFFSSTSNVSESALQPLEPLFDVQEMRRTKALKAIPHNPRDIATHIMKKLNELRSQGKLAEFEVPDLEMGNIVLSKARITFENLEKEFKGLLLTSRTFQDYVRVANKAIREGYEELEVAKRKKGYSDLLRTAT